MSQPFLGEIRLVGFNFAPVSWAFCDGSFLSIASNPVLYTLIGTTYGGDGVNTFALPNLNGRVPAHLGSNGNSTYVQGLTFGQETVSITANQLPLHSHNLVVASTAIERTAGGHYPAAATTIGANPYGPYDDNNLVAMETTTTTGLGNAHENRQPFLVMNYIIALFGIFPSQ
jgi:microcystin-dependent protein